MAILACVFFYQTQPTTHKKDTTLHLKTKQLIKRQHPKTPKPPSLIS